MSHKLIKKPVIAISMGDPNGIGAEIIMKALQRRDVLDRCTPLVVMPVKLWNFYTQQLGIKLPINVVKQADRVQAHRVNVFYEEDRNFQVSFGEADSEAGALAFQSLETAVNLVKNGHAQALVTAPINKFTIQSEHFDFPGHTEYLETRWQGNSLMLLIHELLRVAMVTSHVPLQKVPEMISKERLQSKIRELQSSMVRDFGISRPKIAILGLNPHSGDNGLLGKEENEIIIPLIAEMWAKGDLIFGPFAADSFFQPENLRKFDAVLGMYHDQVLIPFKTMAMWEGVNFTAGLEFVRTSPDHGTGFDIAGKNIADETSMVEALLSAVDLFLTRSEYMELTANPLLIGQKEQDS